MVVLQVDHSAHLSAVTIFLASILQGAHLSVLHYIPSASALVDIQLMFAE